MRYLRVPCATLFCLLRNHTQKIEKNEHVDGEQTNAKRSESVDEFENFQREK
jgi:hypothetical protein